MKPESLYIEQAHILREDDGTLTIVLSPEYYSQFIQMANSREKAEGWNFRIMKFYGFSIARRFNGVAIQCPNWRVSSGECITEDD